MEVRKPSAKYLAGAALKQTEVGCLPSDWHVQQIDDFQPFVTSGSRGWASFYNGYGSLFVRITNLTRDRIYLDLSDVRFVNLPAASSEGQRTQLKAGDVLISITADIGIVGYVTETVPQPAYINQHIALVRFDPTKVHSRYVTYFLASERVQKIFRSLTDSGAKAGMNLATVRLVKFAVPDTLAEQQSIATALSDADALIESLEQLLAKKRQIKQGAMQELLTGKRRLPGFEGEWRAGLLSDVLDGLIAGVSVNSDDGAPIDGVPCVLKTSALSNGKFVEGERKAIVRSDWPRAQTTLQANSILISRMNTPDLVGEVAYVAESRPSLFLPDRVWMTKFQPGVEVDVRWLSYLLCSTEYKRKIKDLATGTSGSMKNISKGALFELPVSFPEPAEQAAIATILSDMDTDITALEAKLAKARAIKQGMMQELLTGRIRLVEKEAA